MHAGAELATEVVGEREGASSVACDCGNVCWPYDSAMVCSPVLFGSFASGQVSPISLSDFTEAFRIIRPSVAPDSLARYAAWNTEYGSKA
jgi:hypothetical protein